MFIFIWKKYIDNLNIWPTLVLNGINKLSCRYCLNEIFFYILLYVIFIFLNLYLMVLDFTSMSTSDLLHYSISIDNINLLPSSILMHKAFFILLESGIQLISVFNIFIYFETYSLIASLLIVIVLKDILNI